MSNDDELEGLPEEDAEGFESMTKDELITIINYQTARQGRFLIRAFKIKAERDDLRRKVSMLESLNEGLCDEVERLKGELEEAYERFD